MAVFQHLNRNGITVVMVTHEPDIAHYATRRLTFRDGLIISDDRVVSRRSAEQELAARRPEPVEASP
jgi:putative ABC transport system ATP-binding protein